MCGARSRGRTQHPWAKQQAQQQAQQQGQWWAPSQPGVTRATTRGPDTPRARGVCHTPPWPHR
jgi:hypothetical protein